MSKTTQYLVSSRPREKGKSILCKWLHNLLFVVLFSRKENLGELKEKKEKIALYSRKRMFECDLWIKHNARTLGSVSLHPIEACCVKKKPCLSKTTLCISIGSPKSKVSLFKMIKLHQETNNSFELSFDT